MKISLLPARVDDLRAPADIIRDGLAAAWPADAERGRADVAEVLATIAADPRPAPWGAYWVIEPTCGRAVGLCAFKSAPDRGGEVEIAYYTFPALEGRGAATAMAAAMADVAATAGARCLTASTLPLESASTTVLRRNGFEFVGPDEHPEDGLVWLWRRALA